MASEQQQPDLQPGDTVEVDGDVYGVVDADDWMVTLADAEGRLYRVERRQVQGVGA